MSLETQAEAAAADKIPPMSASDLKIPEDNSIPLSTQGMASDLDNLSSSVSANISRSIPKVLEAEKEKGEAVKTEATGEAQEWEKYQKELRDIYKEGKPSQLALQAAPKLPDDDPLRNFGSLASMIGIFASAFTKRPIVNALNASADAMKAEQAGNREAYDLANQQWKDQTELAFKRHESELKDLNEIMDFAQEDHAAGLAKLKAWGVVNSSQAATMLAEMGDWEEIGKWVSSQQSALTKTKEASIKIEDMNRKKQVYDDTFKANVQAGMPKQQAEAQALLASEGKFTGTGVGGKKYLESVIADPNSTDEEREVAKKRLSEIGSAEKTNPVLSDDDYQKLKELPEIKEAVSDLHKGFVNPPILRGLSVNNPMRQAASRLYAELYPGESLADTSIQYHGKLREASAIGLRAGQLKGIGGYVQQLAGDTKDLSKKVWRGNLVPVNDAYLYALQKSSDQNEADLGVELYSLASEYSKSLNPQGANTDNGRQEAYKIFNEAKSQDAFDRILDRVTGNIEKEKNIYGGLLGEKPEEKKSKSVLPDDAKKQLKKGVHTTFGNGQVWTLDDNGEPQQVQ